MAKRENKHIMIYLFNINNKNIYMVQVKPFAGKN